MSHPQKSGPPNPPPQRQATVIESAAQQPQRRPIPSLPVERPGTVIESDEEERRAHLPGLRVQAGPTPAAQEPVMPMIPSASRAASPFRPTTRPPLALLTVYDDGKLEGEVVRIRNSRFVIGRTDGDLCIPFDALISSRHLEITCQQVGGVWRWVTTDLQSTNGLFVRVSKTPVADKAEFLVGNGRYRFDAMQMDPDVTTDVDPSHTPPGQTHGWGEAPSPIRPPALTEILGSEIGNRILLVKQEYWIGSDPTCPICRPDDPFCEPRHARLHRGTKGAWHVEHNRTLNGLWLRMPQIVVESLVQFQIGEQRFRLKVM
jgi:pSer/pThr/pTyr-binding forkhead associated (FHA) protein